MVTNLRKVAGPIPVIDLFAGPGGLGEGFSAPGRDSGRSRFEIRLSIEKDTFAHQTLALRAFFRQFPYGEVPIEYYKFLRGEISRQTLFDGFKGEAEQAALETCPIPVELKEEKAGQVRELIDVALGNTDRWVLIGGPPCQLYSVAGRSRNRNKDRATIEGDVRQRLYVEYLQVIADHGPAVFVMENVKGLLTATLANQRTMERIVEDLKAPHKALVRENRTVARARDIHNYQLYSLNLGADSDLPATQSLQDFLVHAEHHGVPQARHRIIIIGVRDDIQRRPRALPVTDLVPAGAVLDGLPPLRSGLSHTADSSEAWLGALSGGLKKDWMRDTLKLAGDHANDLQHLLVNTIKHIGVPKAGRGDEFVRCTPRVRYEPAWYLDERLGGVCNHRTRIHMTSDLYRYLYAACFARIFRRSPELRDFPKALLPDHRNVEDGLRKGYFDNRFCVQLPNRPSMTITSHISKDGHYYIHYDPRQCRSLTVREAARLQTFPDNYYFCGVRTSQYVQVGNAVPPLLAREIAQVVYDLLR
jgi:DNA (cytosine-5)-methyltransferase 1